MSIFEGLMDAINFVWKDEVKNEWIHFLHQLFKHILLSLNPF